MKTSSVDVSDVASQLFKILKDISPVERIRIIKASLVLLGEEASFFEGVPVQNNSPAKITNHTSAAGDSGDDIETPQKYLNHKAPGNRGELLAAAARYMEKNEGKESCTRAEIKKVITDARRNFDEKNFLRDMKNATFRAGFFNKGGVKGEYTLSYFGQELIDALPDRSAAKAIKRPGSRKKSMSKKVK
jgi:hypothetical protein